MSAAADILRRIPPQNLEAEQAVIGGVLVDNRQFEPVAEILTVEDFYRESHRLMWNGIEALASARRPIDAITLTEVLHPQLEAIGGPGYIADCAAAVPAPSMTVNYAKIVREKATQRNLLTFGTELAGKAYEAPPQWSPDYTEDLIAAAEYDLAAIASRVIRKPEATKIETLSNVLWKVDHVIDDTVRTGFPTLDRGFGGFNIGHLTILAARTSRGKTALATNFAINAAKAGFQVAFFTLEMSSDEMWLRALGLEAMVDTFRARHYGYRDGETERMEGARKVLEALPLEILYRPSMRPRDVRLECRRVARYLGGLKLVIVDYLGLMRGDRRERERWREMQEIVFALKEIAGELGIPLLALSQINRETDEKSPPALSNLRDTGASEEHASNVLFVWQPPAEKNAAPVYDDWERVEVIIAKQRNGPAGIRVGMEFRKAWGKFESR